MEIYQSEMPTNTIPKILKNMIDTLLVDNAIVSWNIRGDDSMTNLNIRFTNNMADNMDIAYKKVSQSRITRDNKRQREWKATKEQHNTHTLMDMGNGDEIEQLQTKPLHGNSVKDQGTSPCDTDSSKQYLQPIQGKEPCIANPSNMSKGQHIATSPKGNKTKADQRDQCNMREVNNMDKVTKHNDEATGNIGLHEQCRGCGLMINGNESVDEVYQCLYCKDYFLCPGCKASNCHFDHSNTLVLMTMDEYNEATDPDMW